MTIANDGRVIVYFGKDVGGSLVLLAAPAGSVAIGTWAHIVLVRSGDNFVIYVNGINKASRTLSGALPQTSGVKVGTYLYGTTNYRYKGYIDELRISKGVARWTTDFAPPTQAYTN